MNASRRGMALLLALAVLLLVMAGIAAALGAAGALAGESATAASERRLGDALRSGEALALAWVRASAARAVAPPHGGGIAVCRDRWATAGLSGSLQVDVYDALAGVPAHLTVAGAPLRLALPQALRALVVPVGTAAPVPTQGSDLIERLNCPGSVRRFPLPLSAPACRWGSATAEDDPLAPAAAPALAVAVSPWSDGGININTAPIEVLALAFQVVGRGGLDALVERRRMGSFSEAGTDQRAHASGIRLVDHSSLWYALITASADGVRRSWWVVIAGNPGQSRIVQRHAADR